MPRNNNNRRQNEMYERWANIQREYDEEMAAAEEAAAQEGEQLIGPNNVEAIHARAMALRPEFNYEGTRAAPAARKSRRANRRATRKGRKSRRVNRKARKSRRNNLK